MSAGRRPAIRTSAVATGRGDDGTTGLLYGGPRIGKDDPRTEAYGTVDEAVAALGVARAAIAVADASADVSPTLDEIAELILRFQRELFVVGAELATTPDAWDRLEDGRTRVSEAMLGGVEAMLAELEAAGHMPTEFVIPGETQVSAALDVARTVLRRAERRAVALRRDGLVPGEWLVPYLNRLADLAWVLARAAERAGSAAARPAVTGHGRPGGRGR